MTADSEAPGELAGGFFVNGDDPEMKQDRRSLRVLKFGGSSVADGERLERVARIVYEAQRGHAVVVVVSALGTVTNRLEEAILQATEGESPEALLAELSERHRRVAHSVAAVDALPALVTQLDDQLAVIAERLRGASLLRECSPRARDSILSVGEELSSLLLTAALRKMGLAAERVRAQELLRTDSAFGDARVDLETSRPVIRERLLTPGPDGSVPVRVVPGFTGEDLAGRTTTLGRGGSDYTAAVLGAALDAEAIELWTDVDGVMSADPRWVEGAFSLPSMTYAELLELAHFGAGVVYAPTVAPARRQGIALWIKNTFAPDRPGTLVSVETPRSDHLIRGVASIPEISLLGLAGSGLAEVTSAPSRLLSALARGGIRVLLISQSSVEGSITVAVRPADLDSARQIIEQEFALEIQVGLIERSLVEEGLSVVTAVGEGMRERVGVSGRLFGVLGRNGISVRVTVQSSSERSITVVVAHEDHDLAVREVHDAFFAPRPKPAELLLVGVGQVGGALLGQLAALQNTPGETPLRLVGLADSRGAVFAEEGIDPAAWREALAGERIDLTAACRRLAERPGTGRILVDCTASAQLVDHYSALLPSGVSVVAANKRPFSAHQALYDHLTAAARDGGSRLLLEATVGAGLPLLGTIRDLRRTGDRVERVFGVLSGTLNFVLDRIDGGGGLVESIREAEERGYTEPHPADDLGGADVVRKLCILARQLGHRIEPEEVECRPLVDLTAEQQQSLDPFWAAAAAHEDHFAKLRTEAREAGQRLRFVAELICEARPRAKVGLMAVSPKHPCFGVTGADNVVALYTERYRDSPILIQGPGAGPAVTAAGVLGDLFRAAQPSGVEP